LNRKYLEASVNLINQSTKFECQVEGKEPVIVDYIPPFGDGIGYTSLELLLMSLASCFGSTVKLMINTYLKKQITGFTILASGTRKEGHPTSFESITLKLEIVASNVSAEELDKTIQFAKDSICPVWDMLSNNVEITVEYTIISPYRWNPLRNMRSA
jgi:putative redox protein